MTRGFDFTQIEYRRSPRGVLILQGNVRNKLSKPIHAAVFTITIYLKDIPIAMQKLTVNGLNPGQEKSFECEIGEIDYNRVIMGISGYEIFEESSY